jgi:splicing factor 3B subunit 1
MRISVGPGILLLYILQGLWHPARRVRQIYWRLYNMIYVGNQDSLVPFQPQIPDDEKNCYYQAELMSVL